MRVGITIFGEPPGYPTDSIIAEYKNFIESNSDLTLDLVIGRYSALSSSELLTLDGGDTWFIDPTVISTTHRSQIPTNVHTNIVLYDWINLIPAHGALTWGGYHDPTGNNIPFTGIPIGYSSTETSPDGPWNYGLSNAITHGFLHGLGGSPVYMGRDSSILGILGFSDFIDIDCCCKYGYNYNVSPGYYDPDCNSTCPAQNDPGWRNCMRYFLNQITSPMYTALQTLGTVTFRTNPGGCDIWKNNIYTTPIKLGTTDSSGNLSVSNLMSGTIDFIAKKTGYLDSAEARVIAIGSQSVNSPIVTLSSSGFGAVGVVLLAGLAIGAIYMAKKKK